MPEDKPFVQTLIKGGNHWICISNVQSSLDVCTVYDSGFTLYRYTPEDIKMLNLKIAKLFKTKKDFIQVRFADVKQQEKLRQAACLRLHRKREIINVS